MTNPHPRIKTAAEAEAYLKSSTPSSSSSSIQAEPSSSVLQANPASSASSSSSASPLVFGSRLFREGVDDPNTHNAWDHVEPPPEYLATIQSLLSAQAQTKIPPSQAEELYHDGQKPAGHWDHFYSQHEHRFFKDRKWLGSEFPELIQCTTAGVGKKRILEVGCGAGNTVFPLLAANRNRELEMFACDYSSEAIHVVRSQPLYVSPPIGKCEAFVWDLSSVDGPPPELEEESMDIVCLIFCLSALHPREWNQAAVNLKMILKPGGLILVRDYARYDLPQLRFRKGRMLDDNFYVRGDGTRVYFFTPEELRQIFNAGPPLSPSPSVATPDPSPTRQGTSLNLDSESTNLDSANLPQKPVSSSETIVSSYDFDTLQMAIDRRMLVNRKEDKKMYRSWIQTKLRKR